MSVIFHFIATSIDDTFQLMHFLAMFWDHPNANGDQQVLFSQLQAKNDYLRNLRRERPQKCMWVCVWIWCIWRKKNERVFLTLLRTECDRRGAEAYICVTISGKTTSASLWIPGWSWCMILAHSQSFMNCVEQKGNLKWYRAHHVCVESVLHS